MRNCRAWRGPEALLRLPGARPGPKPCSVGSADATGSELSRPRRAGSRTAQGLAKPRPKGPIGKRHLRALVDTIGTIQLDAINVVARTQFIVPFSRLGPYDVTHLQKLTGAHGELFEYWAHAACLLPVADEPLFRWRMAQHGPYGDRPLDRGAAGGLARAERRRTSRRCWRRCASADRSRRRS